MVNPLPSSVVHNLELFCVAAEDSLTIERFMRHVAVCFEIAIADLAEQNAATARAAAAIDDTLQKLIALGGQHDQAK